MAVCCQRNFQNKQKLYFCVLSINQLLSIVDHSTFITDLFHVVRSFLFDVYKKAENKQKILSIKSYFQNKRTKNKNKQFCHFFNEGVDFLIFDFY